MPPKSAERSAHVARARRAAGQAAAVASMIEKDAYCIDVLTQIAAARAALLALARGILASHLNSCVVDAFKGGESSRAIRELDSVLQKFVK